MTALAAVVFSLAVAAGPGASAPVAARTSAAASALAAESTPADPAPADPWVEKGREALGSWFGYPWYDAHNDAIRQINIRAPAQPFQFRFFDFVAPLFRVTAWTVLAALLGLIAWQLVRRCRRPTIVAGESAAADVAAEPFAPHRFEALPFPLEAQPSDLLGEARQAAARGDFNRAMVLLYSHQLLALDHGHRIQLGRGKTNRQYLRELGLAPLRPLLEESMIAFEDAFFGGRALSRERFERCWNRLEDFTALAAAEVLR